MSKVIRNKYEYITCDMLEDIGCTRILDEQNGKYDTSFEIGYSHPDLEPFNLIIVDYKNGSWHFAQRKHSYNGIGKMVYIDDLIAGWTFVTGHSCLK
jgi:hypothetical protein